jgi:SAM-dependent methyltransferase
MRLRREIPGPRAPRTLVRRFTYRIWRALFPRTPWLAPAAVRFLRRRLSGRELVFEWGSGWSTVWLARRAGRVVSIESDEAWFAKVAQLLERERLENVDLRFVAREDDACPPGDFRAGASSRYVRCIEDLGPATCDVVLVDGTFREACVLAALDRVRPGGHLLIDNTNYRRDRDWRVPSGWPVVLWAPYSATETTIWQRPMCEPEGAGA